MTVPLAAALEKRIKRRILAEAHEARIVPAPGWKDACASELRSILASLTQPGKFTPEWFDDPEGLGLRQLDFRQLMEIPQSLLTAQACFWKILDRHVGSFGELTHAVKSLDADLYLPSQASFTLKVQSFQSHLYHEGKLFDLISQQLLEQGFAVRDGSDFHLLAEQRGNRFSLFLALGPYPLHHRHYKAEGRHSAPLQECLAASAIRWFFELPEQKDWKPEQIAVPFAGSGTLLFETWMVLGHIPSYLWSPENFLEKIPAAPGATLQSIRQRLLQRISPSLPPALLIEKDSDMARDLVDHVTHFKEKLPVNPTAITSCADFFSTPLPSSGRIFMPLNPPYGLRLAQEGKSRPADFYRQLGSYLVQVSRPDQDLRGFVLTPDEDSLQALRQAFGSKAISAVQSFTQGGQHIRCVAFRLGG